VVNGQSWVVGGVEYLGRGVVELNGPDTVTWSPSVANHKTANSITLQIKDVISGVSSAGDIINAMQAGGALPCWWLYHANETVVFVLKDVDTGDFQADTQIPSLFDGALHEFKVEFSDLDAKLIVDGITKLTLSLAGKTLYDCESIRMQDGSTGIRPLQVCCIQQSVNGTLIDNIPCDESTGTELRNTISPLRPATLSDATAHALALVKQAAITKTVWAWDGLNFLADDLIPIELTASGTGAGVTTIRLKSTEANALSLSGGGRFYSDAAGTLGETTSVTLAANVASNVYCKLPSGKSTLYVQKGSKINDWGRTTGAAFAIATNAPTVSKFNTKYISKDVVFIRIEGSSNALSGVIHAWPSATYVRMGGDSTQITYTSKTWRATLSRLLISSSSMTSAMVDQALIDIDASGTTAIGDKNINLAGLCGVATAASAAARTSLATKTFAVVVNL
jgi:hypothetical protein